MICLTIFNGSPRIIKPIRQESTVGIGTSIEISEASKGRIIEYSYHEFMVNIEYSRLSLNDCVRLIREIAKPLEGQVAPIEMDDGRFHFGIYISDDYGAMRVLLKYEFKSIVAAIHEAETLLPKWQVKDEVLNGFLR